MSMKSSKPSGSQVQNEIPTVRKLGHPSSIFLAWCRERIRGHKTTYFSLLPSETFGPNGDIQLQNIVTFPFPSRASLFPQFSNRNIAK